MSHDNDDMIVLTHLLTYPALPTTLASSVHATRTQTFAQHEPTYVMGNSPSSGQRGFETYDTRDIDGAGLKDESPYEFHELAGATKIKTIESSRNNT